MLLPNALPIVLQVIDHLGNPVEGVPLRIMTEPFRLEGACTSDQQGLATFFVPPHSSGEIGVFPVILPDRRADDLEPETVRFEIGCAEDQSRLFTLVLSGELRTFLFERRK